ncbi:MAG: glycosyltransferase family 39 protein [Acidobacteria bacterium]|nr:glycosyltransferase family 39 protein [Acidobacteriota bacterium]
MVEKYRVVVLAAMVGLSLFLRLHGLGEVGFSEDEVHKVEAARAYLRGNVFVNLEHPMLMKLLITLSTRAADAWNRHVSPSLCISEEVAVRLPNVFLGSLTGVVIFLIAETMFGFAVGLTSAALWAIGVDSIAINRVAKEDTLLVFFTWLAFYFYLKAKNLGAPTARARACYAFSGASFGLMLASKYFPHYFGLNALYYHLLGRNKRNQPLDRRNIFLILGAMGVAFLLANPVILLPNVLPYLFAYVREEMMTHHGYFMMGHLYRNDLLYTPGNVPLYFYPLLLLVKTPLPLLAALIVGLMVVFKTRHHAGHFFLKFMFLWWIVPFSLLGSKFLRYSLSLMPMVSMISAVGIVTLYQVALTTCRKQREGRFQPVFVATFLALFFIAPLWSAWRSAPFYSLYLNPIGWGRAGYFFPHDEIYDAGLRETIQEICDQAPPGGSAGGESPSVFKYYFEKFGRRDLCYFNLSEVLTTDIPTSAYLVVQDGRKYFENISLIDVLETNFEAVRTVAIGDAVAAKVYQVKNLALAKTARSP